MATVNHLSSVPSSSALCEAESLKMSPPSSGYCCSDFWETIPQDLPKCHNQSAAEAAIILRIMLGGSISKLIHETISRLRSSLAVG